jgi:hypothetical protein
LGSIGVETEEIGCLSCDSRLFSWRPDAGIVTPDAGTVTTLRAVGWYSRAPSATVTIVFVHCFTLFELVFDPFSISLFALVC